MVNPKVALRCFLAGSVLAACLCACAGSGSSSSSGAAAANQSASWTDVSVRALDGKVNISWEKATGSAGAGPLPAYNIYCSTNSAGVVKEGNRIASGFLGQSFDHTNVTNGQRYYYVVTQVTATGESSGTRTVSAMPQAAQPAAPSGLKVTALDGSTVLSYTGPVPSGTATVSYNVYRSTTRGSFTANNRVANNVNFTVPYSDANLSNGTTYYYAATAVVAGRESGFSPVVSARPQAAVAAVASGPAQLAAFASPTEISVEAGNGSCSIAWKDVGPLVLSESDPAGFTAPDYVIYWSESQDVLNNVKGQKDDAAKGLTRDALGHFTYQATGLTNGTTYYFQLVAAVKGSDGKPISGRFTSAPLVSATPAPLTPAVPTGVSASQGPQQVVLSWNKDSSGIAGVTYNIYVSTTEPLTPAELMATGTKKNSSDSSKPFFTHSGLQTGTTYYYVITSVAEGESAPSSIVSVTL